MLDLNLIFCSKVKGAGVAFNFGFGNRVLFGEVCPARHDHSCKATFHIFGFMAGAFCFSMAILKRYEGEGKQWGAQSKTISSLAMFLSSLFINLYDFFCHLHVVLFYSAPSVPILLESDLLAALRSRGALMKR